MSNPVEHPLPGPGKTSACSAAFLARDGMRKLTGALLLGSLLAACGGTASVSSSASSAPATSAKPAASSAPATSSVPATSAKPAASSAPAASSKPAASTGGAQAGGAAGVTPLIAAAHASAPAGPPPSSAAPSAAAKPSLPAALTQSVGPFYASVETLTAPVPGPGGLVGEPPCVVSGIFKRGQKLVFRYEVVDTSTGKRVTGLDGSTTQVVVNNGKPLPGTFAPRGNPPGPNAPWDWFAVWDIPNDAPTGPVNYSIKITTKAGKTGTWTPPALVLPPGGPAGPAGASSVLNVMP